MARRGHTEEGKIFCSECGSIIEKGTDKCEHCTEPLEGDFEAVLCPYCTTVLNADSENCTNCGLRFKKESETPGRSKEDEEFLSRLLEWGKNLEAKRVKEDKEETEKAAEIFKDVVGSSTPTPLQEETLHEIKKSAEERAVFEKREESIVQMATPLKKALGLRKQALDDLETKNKRLQEELEELKDDDIEADRKRSEIERQMAEILVERSAIQSLEENIANMDSAYRQLLKQHSVEIREKEENLNTRLGAFKKEMERRDKEKGKLKSREEFLEKKEKELVDRIDSLRERENSLKNTEERMKGEIAALEEERKGLGGLRETASNIIISKGKWLVSEEDLANVLKKSKKVRETWLEEQREIQKSLSVGESAEQAGSESEERFRAREEELTQRIEALEAQLSQVQAEEKDVEKAEERLISDEIKLKKVLKVLDDLLEHLPDDIIDKFAKSKDYKAYDELMEELGL